jgi:hypothetical protein
MYNLDCMLIEELRELAPSLPQPLKQYARLKTMAMFQRSRGNIALALKLESTCDRIYNSLGENEKW